MFVHFRVSKTVSLTTEKSLTECYSIHLPYTSSLLFSSTPKAALLNNIVSVKLLIC